MLYQREMINYEKLRKDQKKEEKYRKTSNYKFKKEILNWWENYRGLWYWRRDLDKSFAAYMQLDISPFEYVDGCADESFKITGFAIHQDLRGIGLGTHVFDGICRAADRTGSSLFLCAIEFELEFSDDPKETIDRLQDTGCGFSQPFLDSEIRPKSRYLQNWYINKFNFQRCKIPKSNYVFGSKYLEKKACLVRISENAKPEFKDQIKKYIR